MATIACPNCGKPLRPGARFCGSCGHVLSAPAQKPAVPAASPSGAAGPTESASNTAGEINRLAIPPGFVACPNCGQPLRVEAKFCNICGKPTIAQAVVSGILDHAGAETSSSTAVVSAPAPAASSAKESTASAAQPALSRSPAQKKPASVSGSKPLPPPQAKHPARTGLRAAIILVVLALCGAGAVGAYFAYDYYWGAPGSTNTPVAGALLSPSPESPAATTQVSPSAETPNQPLATTAVPPVASLTSTPTITQTSAPEATNTSTPVSPNRVLLEELFQTPLALNWLVWGQPKPRLVDEAIPPYLELTAGENAGTGGVTSALQIPFDSGVQIEFLASLNERFGYPMNFYWDPVEIDRKRQTSPGSGGGAQEENTGQASPPPDEDDDSPFPFPFPLPGFGEDQEVANSVGIQVNILRDQVSLFFPGRKVCSAPLDGRKQHTYLIRVVEGPSQDIPFKVEFLVDGQALSSCEGGDFPFDFEGGKLSFTGHGLVYSVKVMVP